MKKKIKQQNINLERLKSDYFLDPEGKNIKNIIKQVEAAINSLVDNQGNSPMYPISHKIPKLNQLLSNSKIPEKMNLKPEVLLTGINKHVQGMVKAGNPFMVRNIIPTASIPALSTYFAVSMYMPNGVTGEDSGQTLHAEIECSIAIAKLAGINPQSSAGVFTFGGTATNMYGIKIGLCKALPGHDLTGIREDAILVESMPAHYSHKSAAVWLGIGQNNVITVRSHINQTTDYKDLEEKCRKILKNGKKIIAINGLGGTTSNMGIDDFKIIYNIREKLVKEFNLNYKPHIHADSVLGWAFLVFRYYDFKLNPMQFSEKTIKQIKKILKRIKTLRYVDSFGVDFHKSGYMAYTTSMIIVKNKKDLMLLERNRQIMTPLFHDQNTYNPGMFTLETSRSAANILATWIGLQAFGIEGYQLLLGHSLEMSFIIRSEVEKNIKEGIFIANQDQYGPDVFIRCYPPKIMPDKEYKDELTNDIKLKNNSSYTSDFFAWLEKIIHDKDDGFAISKSSAAIYTHTLSPMVALRVYPLSPFITSESAKILVQRLIKYKKIYDKERK